MGELHEEGASAAEEQRAFAVDAANGGVGREGEEAGCWGFEAVGFGDHADDAVYTRVVSETEDDNEEPEGASIIIVSDFV
jgi:hypothetical protein